MVDQVMGSDHIQEKTEILHALINGRKLSDLPKITQVASFSSQTALIQNAGKQVKQFHMIAQPSV
jgi:hypothetical protein